MQAMGTPITVTTPNPGDVAAIQPASGTPAAPFDAVLALVAPDAGITDASAGTPALTAGPAGVPTGPVVAMPPLSAETALPALAIPPVQPVFSTLVNATDPAEADIAALMAASALATRGVAARPPEPIAPPMPALAEPMVSPDFIGPVRPPELTADPAALVAVAAAGLPEAAELPAMEAGVVDHEVPADFIGPVLPAARRAPLADVPPPPQPVVGMVDADNLSAAAPLPQPQALLQPKSESIALEQSEDVMAMPAVMTPDPSHASVQAEGFVLAASMSPSAAVTMNTPDETRLDKTTKRSAMLSSDKVKDVETSSFDVKGLVAPIAVTVVSPTVISGPVHENASPEDDKDETTLAASAEIPTAQAGDNLVVQPAGLMVPQPAQPSTSPDGAGADVQFNPRMAQPVAIDPRPLPQPLSRDEALLRVMNEIAPAKPQSTGKGERTMTVRVTANNVGVSPLVDGANLSELAPRENTALNADADDALRRAVARATIDRNDARHLTDTRSDHQQADRQAERTLTDPKILAMVRDVTITPGTSTVASEAAVAAASVAQTPIITPSPENVARNASAVAAVNADGRRDTQRDAEIRQRQVEQQINIALRSGTPEIRMQLYPPGLGQVIIRLALDGQKLRLSMTAGNDEASESLAQTELGLRDALARDGYTLAGFDVHDNGDHHRRQNGRADVAPQSSTSTVEGDAFSVDMTA